MIFGFTALFCHNTTAGSYGLMGWSVGEFIDNIKYI
jgi:hypothetical protein